MTFDEQWQQPVDVQLTLGELMVVHAALTDSIARLWVPDIQEPAELACHELLRTVAQPSTTQLCDRLLHTILQVAPDLAPEVA